MNKMYTVGTQINTKYLKYKTDDTKSKKKIC